MQDLMTLYFPRKMLSAMEEFRNLDRDIENNSKRWRKFVEAEVFIQSYGTGHKIFHQTPEKEKFPQEWKKKDALQKLCMMRYSIFTDANVKLVSLQGPPS